MGTGAVVYGVYDGDDGEEDDNDEDADDNPCSSYVTTKESLEPQITLDNNTSMHSVPFGTEPQQGRRTKFRNLRKNKLQQSTARNVNEFHSTLTGSTRKGIKTILGRDADDFKTAQEMHNNIRWQEVAHRVDDFSRVFVPATYAIFLAVTFATRGS